MASIRFKQVDVFTDRPFYGNPVAVVLDAVGLSDADMQRVARWTNLSETTFVLPSRRADYRLRIFTPDRELTFAGHPTIGSAHAVREAGLVSADRTSFVQECAARLVPLTVDERGRIHARVPTPRVLERKVDPTSLATALGAPVARPLAIDVGPIWIVGALEGPAVLSALAVDAGALARLSVEAAAVGATVYAVDPIEPSLVRVRSFAPAAGVAEDPVCGSGNAAVAAHVRATGLQARLGDRYLARQGRELGRDGVVEVRIDGEEVYVGGAAVTVIDGDLRLGG